MVLCSPAILVEISCVRGEAFLQVRAVVCSGSVSPYSQVVLTDAK